jgi:hypothetical protein
LGSVGPDHTGPALLAAGCCHQLRLPVARVVLPGPNGGGRVAIASDAGCLWDAGDRVPVYDLETGIAAQCCLDGLVAAAEHDRVHIDSTHLQKQALCGDDLSGHPHSQNAGPARARFTMNGCHLLVGHQLSQRKLPVGIKGRDDDTINPERGRNRWSAAREASTRPEANRTNGTIR